MTHRTPYAELSDEAKKRAICRAKANVYLRRGKIARATCSVCGAEKAQMHHDNYDEPLKVTWLCKRCHTVEHHEKYNPRTPRPNLQSQIAARARGDRKNVFHGGTLCSCCMAAPRSPSHAYCGPCMAKYMRDWRKTQRERIALYKAELHRLKAIAEGIKG